MNKSLINKINQRIGSNSCRPVSPPALSGVLKDMLNRQVAEVTYAELATYIEEEKVTPGLLYKIKDRGDRGIFVTGVTQNSVSKEGIRLMLCPATYAEGDGWIGIWRAGKSVSVGSKAIWGGKVWMNLTGSIGTSSSPFSLNATHWQLIPKDSFENDEYVLMQFGVFYDFAHDWIDQQWDNCGNVLGVSYAESQYFEGFAANPCDVSDWNYGSAPYAYFFKNTLIGFWNNSGNYEVVNNTCLFGSITNNSCTISNNTATYGIIDNTITGSILQNVTAGISFNSNTGDIYKNRIVDLITNNSNTGSILKNECLQISGNSNAGAIFNNKVFELAVNSNNGEISNNSNNGDILSNQNNGDISYNRNNGRIFLNGSAVENIQYNINNGEIKESTTVGDVTDAVVNK